MTAKYEALTTAQVAFLCFQHVHCAMLTLRRCLLGVNHRSADDRRTLLGHCQRPATMRQKIDLGHSEYLCDACAEVFHRDRASFTELPHAAVVRQYGAFAASNSALDSMSEHEAVALARALVTALPPCPNATVDMGLLDAVAQQPFMPLGERVAMAASAVSVIDPIASCPRCAGLAYPPVLDALMDLDEFLSGVNADPRFGAQR